MNNKKRKLKGTGTGTRTGIKIDKEIEINEKISKPNYSIDLNDKMKKIIMNTIYFEESIFPHQICWYNEKEIILVENNQKDYYCQRVCKMEINKNKNRNENENGNGNGNEN